MDTDQIAEIYDGLDPEDVAKHKKANAAVKQQHKFWVTIWWGHNEHLDGGPITYGFNSKKELFAFLLGADESSGWSRYSAGSSHEITVDLAECYDAWDEDEGEDEDEDPAE